jgi:hypothetical protein
MSKSLPSLAFFLFTAAAYAQIPCTPGTPDSCFQVRYVANLAIGDSTINFTNDGAPSIAANVVDPPYQQSGQLCANVYAYSPDEQLVSCCSCVVTPNGLNSLSVKEDLASNTLTPILPSSLVVKLLVTEGCTPSSAATAGNPGNPLRQGLLAWATTLHPLPVGAATPATTYGVTETAFANPTLSEAERTRMTQLCSFIRANGSGYGICKSCRVGGLGASTKSAK